MEIGIDIKELELVLLGIYCQRSLMGIILQKKNKKKEIVNGNI